MRRALAEFRDTLTEASTFRDYMEEGLASILSDVALLRKKEKTITKISKPSRAGSLLYYLPFEGTDSSDLSWDARLSISIAGANASLLLDITHPMASRKEKAAFAFDDLTPAAVQKFVSKNLP